MEKLKQNQKYRLNINLRYWSSDDLSLDTDVEIGAVELEAGNTYTIDHLSEQEGIVYVVLNPIEEAWTKGTPSWRKIKLELFNACFEQI